MTPRQAIAKGISALRALVAGGDIEAADAMAVLATLLVERRKPRDADSPGARRMRELRRRKDDPPEASQGASQAPSQQASQTTSQGASQGAAAASPQTPLSDLQGGKPLALTGDSLVLIPTPDPSQPLRIASCDGSAMRVTRASQEASQRAITKPPRRKPRAPQGDGELPTFAAWTAYAIAYSARYGLPPVRNAKVNTQMRDFCARIPAADAVATIEHYVRSQNARYVGAGHALWCLVQDAEKLRTEALTGRQTTAYAAQEADRRAGAGAEHAAVIARMEAEEAAAEARRSAS